SVIRPTSSSIRWRGIAIWISYASGCRSMSSLSRWRSRRSTWLFRSDRRAAPPWRLNRFGGSPEMPPGPLLAEPGTGPFAIGWQQANAGNFQRSDQLRFGRSVQLMAFAFEVPNGAARYAGNLGQ